MEPDPLAELIALTRDLHLQDIETQGLASDPTSADSLAFQLYAAELEDSKRYELDRVMAVSLDRATQSDGALLEELAAIERVAAADRELAIRLEQGGSTRPSSRASTASTSTSTSSGATASTSASSLFSPATSNSSSSTFRPLTSTSSPRAPPIKIEKMVDCVICGDRVVSSKAVQVPCAQNHYYDIGCLKELFLMSIRDESLFPPKCDRVVIPPSLVFPHFTSVERQRFTEKSVEFTTLNRVYCSKGSCSKFLGAGTTGISSSSSIRCGDCGSSTCTSCKAPAHGIFGVCSNSGDEETKASLRRDHGLQECPKCKRMIELESGCYHMKVKISSFFTCRCSAQYCYLCAADWKTCACPQWEEARLLVAANQRVVAEAAARVEQNLPPPVVQVPLAQQVRRVAEELRVNHFCAHERWSYRAGGGQCESCFNNLRGYLLRCRGCAMLACVRCQRNRL